MIRFGQVAKDFRTFGSKQTETQGGFELHGNGVIPPSILSQMLALVCDFHSFVSFAGFAA